MEQPVSHILVEIRVVICYYVAKY